MSLACYGYIPLRWRKVVMGWMKFDTWSSTGPLSNVTSNRDIYRAGFSLKSKVADILNHNNRAWPHAWVVKYPILVGTIIPTLSNNSDEYVLRNLNNKEEGYSVSAIWNCIRPRNEEGPDWFKYSSLGYSTPPPPYLTTSGNIPPPLSPQILDSDLFKVEIKKVPVWVKFYHVPIVAYSKVGLSLITTQVGKPIRLDAPKNDLVDCYTSVERIRGSFIRLTIPHYMKTGQATMVPYMQIFDQYDEMGGPKTSKVVATILQMIGIEVGTTQNSVGGSMPVFLQENQPESVPLVNLFSALNEDEDCDWKDPNSWQHSRSVLNESDSDVDEVVAGKWCSHVEGHSMLSDWFRNESAKEACSAIFCMIKANLMIGLLDEVDTVVRNKSFDEGKVRWRFTGNSVSETVFVDFIMRFLGFLSVPSITNNEIKRAMFDIGDDKASGPDGYTSAFLKKGWDVVVMHKYHRIEVPPRCAFKGGYSRKAYDTGKLAGFWELFLKVLVFLHTLISGSWACVKSPFSFRYVSMVITTMVFQRKGGFRQGDPLSPNSCFTLVMEGFDIDVDSIERMLLSDSFSFLSTWCAFELKDCKRLVESRPEIGYWASVLAIPFGIIDDIQQLIRGFLWCNGEYRRGKSKMCDVEALKTRDGIEAFRPRFWLFLFDICVGMESVAPILEDIITWFLPIATKHSFNSIVGKLLFGAAAYYIWIERNNRLFKKSRRSPEEIRDLVVVTVRLKLVKLRFKNKPRVVHMEDA
ncbi:reverse transcriptase domain, reverse transcriptase zinc-binding domain protein [Tanacetum coccineum]